MHAYLGLYAAGAFSDGVVAGKPNQTRLKKYKNKATISSTVLRHFPLLLFGKLVLSQLYLLGGVTLFSFQIQTGRAKCGKAKIACFSPHMRNTGTLFCSLSC